MKAEDYFRQNVFSVFPSGSTVVSVEPFPELNQIARKQLGLPSVTVTTVALEPRQFAHASNSKKMARLEDWVALAVVTRIFRQAETPFTIATRST